MVLKTIKNNDVASTEDANSSTPYQPNIIVSVKWGTICIIWLPISGKPKTKVDL